jgi:hypothetical protein
MSASYGSSAGDTEGQGASFQVWPGYVAAISSLVLGLLLTASIVATLYSQMSVLAARYAAATVSVLAAREVPPKTPVRMSPQSPAETRVTAAPVPARAFDPRAPAPGKTGHAAAREASEPSAPGHGAIRDHQGAEDNHLTLIFGESLLDIPADRREEIARALGALSATAQSRWRVSAGAPATDPTLRRNTFRLMVAMRNFLVAQGIEEARIEIRLEDATSPVEGVGDITVRIGPVDAGEGASVAPVGPIPVGPISREDALAHEIVAKGGMDTVPRACPDPVSVGHRQV